MRAEYHKLIALGLLAGGAYLVLRNVGGKVATAINPADPHNFVNQGVRTVLGVQPKPGQSPAYTWYDRTWDTLFSVIDMTDPFSSDNRQRGRDVFGDFVWPWGD